MSDRKTIDHIGWVESVSDGEARIRINSQSACTACHARGACMAADQEEKILTVSSGDRNLRPGEQVKVLISARTGLRAVAIGYIYPFLLLMILLITLTAIGLSELQAGLWSLASLLPYYLGVYFLRKRISNNFTFKLE